MRRSRAAETPTGESSALSNSGQRIGWLTGIGFEALRAARHLRHAVAHDQPVNQDTLEQHLAIVTGREPSAPASARPRPARSADLSSVPVSSSRLRAFRVHAWRNDELEASMLANGFVSVGGSEIGDLTDVTDPEQISVALTESMPDRTQVAIHLFVGYWRRFLWDARIGDIVVLPTQTQGVAIGSFASP